MNFIKLTLTPPDYNCGIFINPEYIICMIFDSINNETSIYTRNGSYGVKESPEQIIEMVKEQK